MLETKWIRYELHEQGEDGKWRRVTSSRAGSKKAALQEMLESYRIMRNPGSLRWILPEEMLRRGSLRLVKCDVEILGPVTA